MLTTNLPDIVRQGNPEEAVSVIHAPESFASWVSIARRKLIPLYATWLNIYIGIQRAFCQVNYIN